MNAGFREAMKEEDWDCLFFHDVDLIPEDDRNTYVCDSNPKHAAIAMDKFGYKYVWERPIHVVVSVQAVEWSAVWKQSCEWAIFHFSSNKPTNRKSPQAFSDSPHLSFSVAPFPLAPARIATTIRFYLTCMIVLVATRPSVLRRD